MKIDRAQKAMKAVLKTIPWEGEGLKNWLEQFDGLKQKKTQKTLWVQEESHIGSRYRIRIRSIEGERNQLMVKLPRHRTINNQS